MLGLKLWVVSQARAGAITSPGLLGDAHKAAVDEIRALRRGFAEDAHDRSLATRRRHSARTPHRASVAADFIRYVKSGSESPAATGSLCPAANGPRRASRAGAVAALRPTPSRSSRV